jgi:hypothetical protein
MENAMTNFRSEEKGRSISASAFVDDSDQVN